mmetsp:Transcript_2105/g.3029  ORF Transcript_2105/g.3029 Transcript_2105/m.3029 type:complete len:141 (+) Transcript_2105:110-532(+)|eukprot:CAMPEP_0167760466 /NCGR_PEP_ID=MMETSP0110_2-20121227/11605_1 /TAXON_ID=629695 /ORGANISM="Gymnochlora sp., Strain CCMP2014" /LENGTH=140 /DNA_ID=CAMNT_0007646987 /DNA_START=91 /DNA_END=513 /DNA_ORIENTATION=-
MDEKKKYHEEDAAQLKLGSDFKDARCLWNDEVRIILKKAMEISPGKFKNPGMIEDTLNYVTKFSNFKGKEDVSKARTFTSQEMEKGTLEHFEVAVLNNNGVITAEEALELVPSLNDKFPSGRMDELQTFLDNLSDKFTDT